MERTVEAVNTVPCVLCGAKVEVMYTLPCGDELCRTCRKRRDDKRPSPKMSPAAVDMQYHGGQFHRGEW